MKEKLLELLWDLQNYKYPNYDKKADEILRLFSVSNSIKVDPNKVIKTTPLMIPEDFRDTK